MNFFSNVFRNGDVKDKSVLLIGGRLSAEDVALQCHKHGSKEVHVSYHTTPLGYLPSQEHPPITHFEGARTAHFQDGSKADVDLVNRNDKLSGQVSISSTFFANIFCAKKLQSQL